MRNRIMGTLACLALLLGGMAMTGAPVSADDREDPVVLEPGAYERGTEPEDSGEGGDREVADPETDPEILADAAASAMAYYPNVTSKKCASINLRPGFAETKLCATATWQRQADSTGMITKNVRFNVEGNVYTLDSNPALTIHDQHMRGCYQYNYSTHACVYDSSAGSAWNNTVQTNHPRYNMSRSTVITRSQNAAASVYWAHVTMRVNNWTDFEAYVGVIYGYVPPISPGSYNLPKLFCVQANGARCDLTDW